MEKNVTLSHVQQHNSDEGHLRTKYSHADFKHSWSVREAQLRPRFSGLKLLWSNAEQLSLNMALLLKQIGIPK